VKAAGSQLPRHLLLVATDSRWGKFLRAAGVHVTERDSASGRLPADVDGAVIDLSQWYLTMEAVTSLRTAEPDLPIVVLGDYEGLGGDGVVALSATATVDEVLRALNPTVISLPEPAATVPRRGRHRHDSPPERNARQLSQAPDPLALAVQTPPVMELLDSVAGQLSRMCSSDVAILLQRQQVWRVVAGRGLRPLEWRDLEVLPQALEMLTVRQPVLLVGDSDSARSGLLGAPLSRHRSMLLMMATGPMLVVLGREHPYGRDDVQTAIDAVESRRAALDVGFWLAHAADVLESHRLL
jgi:hypothetical protein